MDSLFSKASSFLSSQEAPQAPSHGENVAHDKEEEETRKPASSGGYGDLLAGAQSLMGAASDGGASAAEEGETQKAPSSGGYGDIFASAQSFMGAAKSSSGGAAADKEEEEKEDASSGGSGYADVFASAQVLMGAAKISSRDGGSADMGEVAGAASNIIGAASRYGNLEKTSYGEYTQKAQSYLHDYQVSHSKTAPQKPSPSDEDDYNPSNVSPITPSANSEGETDEESKPKERTKYAEDYSPTPVKPGVNSEEAEQEYE